MYQPLQGFAYECCANAGCGINKPVIAEPPKVYNSESLYNAYPWMKHYNDTPVGDSNLPAGDAQMTFDDLTKED